ncbi:hypothetical protein JS756_11065 [Streptomyces actuosus]|uniref:Aminoglycoside phosphotransferase domain-containing protein n=1 Tax=Streptomyces actuosus TaxID=1885 RepID=A0ABS2VNG0_STRAS|nr:hypothetical protein [Streptomyces actuosus]MBN0044638.1 hypothetical protein [Streptomyces actuosus]
MAHPPPQAQKVFGDATLDLRLAEWLRVNGMELEGPRTLRTGGSGGKLVSAYLRMPASSPSTGGVRIIKLVGSSADAEAEPANHRAALDLRERGTEEFTARHLVGLDLHFLKLDGSWIMFQFPAGDGKEETTTLAELGRTPRLPELVASITHGVLFGWNPRPSTRGRDLGTSAGGEDTPLSAARFVALILGARADGDGVLRSWARTRLGPAVDTEPWFTFPGRGRPLPNPLFLESGSPLGTCALRFAPRGHAHGDLHPGNIMTPVREAASADAYWLVDLSRFHKDALLARDPVHLLVCLIADSFLPHLSDEAREELLTALSGDTVVCTGPLIPQQLARTVERLRGVWIDWGARLGINPGWREQWFLALQAGALAVTARERYADAERWWFLRLAAAAGGAYLDAVGVRPPHRAPAPFPLDPVPVAPVRPGPVQRGPGPADSGRQAVVPAPAAPRAPAPAPAAPPEPSTPPPEPLFPQPRPVGSRPPESRQVEPTLFQVLDDIWETFEHPRRLLNAVRPTELRGPAQAVSSTQRSSPSSWPAARTRADPCGPNWARPSPCCATWRPGRTSCCANCRRCRAPGRMSRSSRPPSSTTS